MFAFLRKNVPASTATGARRHYNLPFSELHWWLESALVKACDANGSGPFRNRGRLSWWSGPMPCRSAVVAASHLRDAPWRGRLQSPVWSKPRRACVRAHGASLHVQILQPVCLAIFLPAHSRGRVQAFLFPAYLPPYLA